MQCRGRVCVARIIIVATCRNGAPDTETAALAWLAGWGKRQSGNAICALASVVLSVPKMAPGPGRGNPGSLCRQRRRREFGERGRMYRSRNLALRDAKGRRRNHCLVSLVSVYPGARGRCPPFRMPARTYNVLSNQRSGAFGEVRREWGSLL